VPYTLLLADDSATIQRVIELTFADEDVTVIAVSDGDQAIARLDAAPPDIVLADIGMPGRNGYDVARYISRSPKLSHIPVVLLTGAFEPVDQTRADEAGCDGVLAKPFEPQQVIGRVKELLARSRGAAPGDELTWAPPFSERRDVPVVVDPPVASPEKGPVVSDDRHDYFDRLDAAFSTLSQQPGQSGAPFGWAELPAASRESQPVADLPLSYEPAAHDPSFDLPDGFAPHTPAEEAAAAPAPPVEVPE
jgi:CheY-like chemotaxis protein